MIIIGDIVGGKINEALSLSVIGINEYAWNYNSIVEMIPLLREKRLPILGGDVYSMNNSTIENSDDNWYYDRIPNESFYDYVQNSCNKSESYIRTFKNHSCDRPLFSFVLEDQLE